MKVYNGYILVADYEQSLFSSLYFAPRFYGVCIYSEHFLINHKIIKYLYKFLTQTYMILWFFPGGWIEYFNLCKKKKKAKQMELFGYTASVNQLNILLLLCNKSRGQGVQNTLMINFVCPRCFGTWR